MRDRSWERRLPQILEALTLDELAYLSAHESVDLGTSERSTEDLAAWFATLPPEGQERVMEVLRARIEASVWRLDVIVNMSDQTGRAMDTVLEEVRRFVDDLRDLGR
jgi:hypothetical protein